jgi:hypothetical protein
MHAMENGVPQMQPPQLQKQMSGTLASPTQADSKEGAEKTPHRDPRDWRDTLYKKWFGSGKLLITELEGMKPNQTFSTGKGKELEDQAFILHAAGELVNKPYTVQDVTGVLARLDSYQVKIPQEARRAFRGRIMEEIQAHKRQIADYELSIMLTYQRRLGSESPIPAELANANVQAAQEAQMIQSNRQPRQVVQQMPVVQRQITPLMQQYRQMQGQNGQPHMQPLLRAPSSQGVQLVQHGAPVMQMPQMQMTTQTVQAEQEFQEQPNQQAVELTTEKDEFDLAP